MANFAGRVPVAEIDSLAEQCGDAARKVDRTGWGGFEDFVTAAQDVFVALLMESLNEVVVNRPAVAFETTTRGA